MLHFTPLLGARAESPASQSLLELDGGVKILVDVGWDERFEAAKLQALEKHVSTLSAILLTHATIAHVGAFAHCCKHIPLFTKIPVYATTPVINLGRALLTDLYASSPLAASIVPPASIIPPASVIPPASISCPATADPNLAPNLLLQPPTPDEIATYFNLVNPLKYSQPHQPIPSPSSPPLASLTVTAYNAGHTLGGTVWHIHHGLESIIYASDWNQSRENLLSSASWLSAGGTEIIEPLRRPTALICSSNGVEKENPLPRKKRDDTLISLIRETIAQGGKVLIPTDSSARVLELAFLLNQAWRENVSGPHSSTYRDARIYLASRTAGITLRYVQGLLEWMDDGVQQDADRAMTLQAAGKSGRSSAAGPLEWTFIKPVERKSQLERALTRSKPSIILASDASLAWGFSRQALQTLASDSKNLVILPDKIPSIDGPGKSGLGSALWNHYISQPGQTSPQSGAKIVNTDGFSVDLQEATTAPLEGNETLLYQQYLSRTRHLQSTTQGDNTAGPDPAAELIDEAASESSDSSEEDEDTEHQGKALNFSTQLTQSNKRKVGLTDAELGVNVLLRSGLTSGSGPGAGGKIVHDYDVRTKRGRERIFPFLAHRPRGDEFGELIKPEEYLRAEERDVLDGVDMRHAAGGGGQDSAAAVGQKRKWDDFAATAGANKARRNSRGGQQGKGKGREAVHTTLSEPDDIDAKIAALTGQAAPMAGFNGSAAVAGEEESGSGSEGEESDYEPEDTDAGPGPKKLVWRTEQLELRLRIAHVDFAGVGGRRVLLMLIPLIRPRKIILIAGGDGATGLLEEECKSMLGLGGAEGGGGEALVFAPRIGEVVDAGVDTNSWSIKLTRQLVRKLTWQNVKGLGVVALTGVLSLRDAGEEESVTEEEEEEVKAEDEGARKKIKLIKSETGNEGKAPTSPEPATIPVLDLPATYPSTQPHRATRPIHVGDLRIADLRNQLRASNHQAEFRGEGTIVVDGSVVVRKGAGGRIEVEAGAGGLRPPQYRTVEDEGSFYAVRRVVYGGLAVVAGV